MNVIVEDTVNETIDVFNSFANIINKNIIVGGDGVDYSRVILYVNSNKLCLNYSQVI